MKTFAYRSMLVCALLGAAVAGCTPGDRETSLPEQADLIRLLELPADELTKLDIGRANLLCAQGLPGCEELDVEARLAVLDQWAAAVKMETARHCYRWARNAGEFEHSKGFFQMLMLGVVLAEDCHIHYRNERRIDPAAATDHDGFFSDASAVFLPGLLGRQRDGTCSSIPVLYVAVGRRLGYPLKLVTTKGHIFVRWEGEGERFNLEVTGAGLNRFDDDYYRQWPFRIGPGEEQSEGYLKSLSPAGELGLFLSIRGMCLREVGRMKEAAVAFEMATRLDPGVRGYRVMAAKCHAEPPVGEVLTVSDGGHER